MPIEHINKTDTLNEGREKLNAAIDGANAADVTSKVADTKATQALANSESTQTQLDTIVIDGDSSVEAAQARVDENGDPHPTLKARIDDGMNSVNQQLAQTEQQRFFESMINKKVPPKKPFITLVDDDGYKGVYTKLFPLAQEYNIPITSAMITNRQMGFPGDDRNYFNRYYHFDEVMEMKESGLVEFVSHTHNHLLTLDKETDETVHEEMYKAREFMKKWGFNHRLVVYPGGVINKNIINIAKQYYDYSTTYGGEGIVVTPPFSNYKIGRVPINQDMDMIKQKIDEAKSVNGWILLRGHIDQDAPDYQEDWYREVIEYALGEGFEFVTHEKGVQHHANIAEITEDDIIAANGEVYGDKLGITTFDGSNEINNTTPLHYFKAKSKTYSLIRAIQSDGFPNNSTGLLETVRMSTNEDLWNYQTFNPLGRDRNVSYIRHWDRYSQDWTDWGLTSATGFLGTNGVESSDKPGDDHLRRRLTYTYLNVSGSVGFPDNKTGYLITNALVLTDSAYQEFHVKNDSLVYKRHWNPNEDKWDDWFVFNSNFPTILKGTNEILPTDKVEDFDVGITIGRTTGAHNFIEGKGGGYVETTRFTGTEYYSAEQTFKENTTVGETVNKYIRIGKSDGTWTSWKKFMLEDI